MVLYPDDWPAADRAAFDGGDGAASGAADPGRRPARTAGRSAVRGLGKRVAKVEAAAAPPPGCPTCAAWWGVVLGDDSGRRSRPEQCPDRGRVVPIELLHVVVSVSIDDV